jgi:putative hydrolase of the HAD superfamily
VTIGTVTVDLWGTLFVDTPSSDNRYKARRLTDFEAILRGDGRTYPRAKLERAYEDSASYLRRVWTANRDVPVSEHVKAILRALDRELGDAPDPHLVEALVDAYARPALLVPPAFDDTARAALTELRARGVTLALISNTMRTPGTVLRKLLARGGLLDVFAHLTFSDEVGIRKPAPEIFLDTLRRVGGDPATAVHVGDDAVLDVDGAQIAGLRVVQVVGRTAAPREARAERTISCLGELPAAIASLEAG